MPLLPSLPEPAHLGDLLRAHPDGVPEMMAFTNAVLRGPGELPVPTRELIAAFTSALNACDFCARSHEIYARAYGVPEGTLDALVADVGSAPVEDRLKPLLAYCAKLVTLPARLVRADVDAVLSAGWSERALYEAIRITAAFAMYNRLVEGTGVDFDYGAAPEAHPAHAGLPADHGSSYAAFGERIAAER